MVKNGFKQLQTHREHKIESFHVDIKVDFEKNVFKNVLKKSEWGSDSNENMFKCLIKLISYTDGYFNTQLPALKLT